MRAVSGGRRGTKIRVGFAPWLPFVSIPTFLRIVGFIFLIAFLSFGAQAPGLIGSHGILPLGEYLTLVPASVAPTVFLWNSSDTAIRAGWVGGVSLGLVWGIGFWAGGRE